MPARQLSALQCTQPALARPAPVAPTSLLQTLPWTAPHPSAAPRAATPRSERMAELLQQQPFGDKAQRYYMTRNDEYTESLKGAVGIW